MTKKEAEEGAASRIAEALRSLAERQGYVVLAVPGGRSVAGIFRLLAGEEVPWEKIHIFLADERLVPIDHEESNYRLVRENLVKPLGEKLPKKNIHPFVLEAGEESKGIIAYEEELKRLGGKYHVVLLSCGEDGHVAGLFPRKSVLKNARRYVVMDDAPKPPPERMTMSRELLREAKVAFLLFFGEGKKEAYKHFIDPKVGWQDCPAKLVKELPLHYVYTAF